MATIAQQLTELVNQKNALAANLTTKGVTASSSETLNTLVPKVLEIQGAGGGDNKFTQLVDRSITTVTAEDLEGITSIGNYAFYNCSSLTSISLPSTLTSIDNQAFYNCRGLTSITIPEGVTSINNQVFYNCRSLTSIIIPESVTSIGVFAFYGCSSITTITIPEGVTSIGNSAFSNCSSLTTMRVEATTPPTLSSTSAISSATTQIQVPMASVEAYKAATNWSNFADIIVGYAE